jgi:hypothetical protein
MTNEEIASAKRGGGSREYMQAFTRGRDPVVCQSCGFTMRRDSDFGTEADGSLAEKYCAGCYGEGRFTEPVDDATAFIEQALERIAKQRKQAMGKVRLDLRKELPRLERWKP